MTNPPLLPGTSALDQLEKLIGEALVHAGHALQARTDKSELGHDIRVYSQNGIQAASAAFSQTVKQMEQEIIMAKCTLMRDLEDLRAKQQSQAEPQLMSDAIIADSTDHAGIPDASPSYLVPDAPMMGMPVMATQTLTRQPARPAQNPSITKPQPAPSTTSPAPVQPLATSAFGKLKTEKLSPRPPMKLEPVTTPQPIMQQSSSQPQPKAEMKANTPAKAEPSPSAATSITSPIDPAAKLLASIPAAPIPAMLPDTSLDNFFDLTDDGPTDAGNATFTDMMFTVDPGNGDSQGGLDAGMGDPALDLASFGALPDDLLPTAGDGAQMAGGGDGATATGMENGTGTGTAVDDLFGDEFDFGTEGGGGFNEDNLDDLLAGFGDPNAEFEDSFASNIGA